jgi:hypothetical protein
MSLLVLFAVGTMTNPRTGYSSAGVSPAAPSAQPQNVNVVNTPAVIAQQAGVWNVGISGTPSVGIDPSNNTVKLDANNSTLKIDSTAPVNVRDADNPARQPVAASCRIDNNVGFPCILTKVPDNKRLVVEMFSLFTAGGGVAYGELNVDTNGSPITFRVGQVCQLVRVYADPGSYVTASGGVVGSIAAISGYLIDP